MKEKRRGRPSFAEVEKRKLREAKKAEKLALKAKSKGTKFLDKQTDKIRSVIRPKITHVPSMSRDASAENESPLLQAVINLTSACMQLIKDNQTLIREVCAPLDIKFKQGMVYTDEETLTGGCDLPIKINKKDLPIYEESSKTFKSAISPKVIVDGAKAKRTASKISEEDNLDDLAENEELNDDLHPIEPTQPKKRRGRGPAKQKALPAPEVVDEEEEEVAEDSDEYGFSDDNDDLSDVPFGAEPPSRKTKANGKVKHSQDLEDILS